MDFSEILNTVLPIVYIIVGIALVWFVVELVFTIRRTRRAIHEVQDQLTPTLDHVEKITADIEPVTAKIDPLVDRASLTVDAANLELMRVDQILEDVTDITDSASKAVDTIGSVTSAPVDFVTSITNRVRSRFGKRKASNESVKLGEKSANDDDKHPNAHLVSKLVDTAGDAVDEALDNARERTTQHEGKQDSSKEQETLKERESEAVSDNQSNKETQDNQDSRDNKNQPSGSYVKIDDTGDINAAAS